MREQIRVVRPGGIVSAVVCFCHADGLPHYHGRFPFPNNQRIDELRHKVWQIYRRYVRPTQLKADLSTATQAIASDFRAAGLQNIIVNGHLAAVSPADARLSLEEATQYALARHEQEWQRLVGRWEQHGDALIAAGFSQAEHEELLALTAARIAYLQEDPRRVREVMETYVDPLLLVRGQKPA